MFSLKIVHVGRLMYRYIYYTTIAMTIYKICCFIWRITYRLTMLIGLEGTIIFCYGNSFNNIFLSVALF